MSNEHALDAAQMDQFVEDGYLRLDGAFSKQLAAECREILWRDTGCDPADPSTWRQPVIRLGEHFEPPFRAAVNTPMLHGAFDSLIGETRWLPRGSLGTFPIRFPSKVDPGDCGWHIDVSFGFESEPDFMEWRVNIASKGRALLMLFLFSDVGEGDAPTVLRRGSHKHIARYLAPRGDSGATLRELVRDNFADTHHHQEVTAVGEAGTVYLVHPFMVHTAQSHHGETPRFLAQPPLLPRVPLDPFRADSKLNAVERAIHLALS
jgi:hypothetical protein